MNLTLSLDDALVKKARKIAVERDTTLTGMVRDYLEKLAAEDVVSGRKRREREALERSFDRLQFPDCMTGGKSFDVPEVAAYLEEHGER